MRQVCAYLAQWDDFSYKILCFISKVSVNPIFGLYLQLFFFFPDVKILKGHVSPQDWSSSNAFCLLGEKVFLLKEESANNTCEGIFKNGFWRFESWRLLQTVGAIREWKRCLLREPKISVFLGCWRIVVVERGR